MPTPEEFAAKMATRGRRGKKNNIAVVDEQRRLTHPDDYNPLPTDIVEDPKPKKVAPVKLPERLAPGKITVTFNSAFLIGELNNIPLEQLSFEDCGLLLNALSSASTKIATTRRERQEQLAAGTHRAPCATCHRPIDITKSGGFQILTVRDEHWQPKNVYFCSQNCLLGRNMPSHRVKKLPGDVGAGA